MITGTPSTVNDSILKNDQIVWVKIAQGEIDPWANPANRRRDPVERAKARLHERMVWSWLHDATYLLARQGDSVYLAIMIDASTRDREQWRRHLADALSGIPDTPNVDEPLIDLEFQGGIIPEDLTPLRPRDLAWPGVCDLYDTPYTGEPLTPDELIDRADDDSPGWLAIMLADCGHSQSDAIQSLEADGSDGALSAMKSIQSKGYGRVTRPDGSQVPRLALVTGDERRAKMQQMARNGSTFPELCEKNLERNEPTLDESELREIYSVYGTHDTDLPRVMLPGGSITVSESAKELGILLAATRRYYSRGEAIVRIEHRGNGDVSLQPLKAVHFSSIFEEIAKLYAQKVTLKKIKSIPTTCCEKTAKLIVHAEHFFRAMPQIKVLSPCPVLIERDGKLAQVVGYDRPSGVLAMGHALPEISIEEARRLLGLVLRDFHFASKSDRSRALAALITPAMVHGGLLGGRAPLDLGEADQSQSGKGFRNRLTAAVYRQEVASITQGKSGVANLEELFNSRLMQGSNFIAIDNVRGEIDSPALESFLTEDSYVARIAYSAPTTIDPRRFCLMMTTNRAEITVDLANRSSCVKILKQAKDYRFAEFSEGNIVDHVRANQPRFLAAVFAVVREWHRRGKKRTSENRHDFREWAQTLDWIVQNVLHEAPLIDGHEETKARVTNPHLGWLRDVAIAVDGCMMAGTWLRAYELLDIMANGNVEIPGHDGGSLDDETKRKKILQSIGSKLARCFASTEGDALITDQWCITRKEVADSDGRKKKVHMFSSKPQK